MRYFVLLLFVFFFFACSLQKAMDDESTFIEEYQKLVKIRKADQSLEKLKTKKSSNPTDHQLVKERKEPLKSMGKPSSKVKKTKIKTWRLPKLEDRDGFDGRRPLVDPFVVGEKTTFDVAYFGVTAGRMVMEVKPFVDVNNRKSYHFFVSLKSSQLFSYFYAVNDMVETYMDYKQMRPYSLSVDVRESKQFKEIRLLFDWKRLKGIYWERKIKKGEKEKRIKKEWDIKDFSQNVVSALYYVRTFQLKPKKKLAFRVADDGKNIVVKGEILRREKLKTEIGTLNTVVLKPEFEIDGIFKPTGDVLIWLTDDDRKRIVRIELKIKIGRIIAKVKSIQ